MNFSKKNISRNKLLSFSISTALLLGSASAFAFDVQPGGVLRQDLSKTYSDDNSSTFTGTGAVPKLGQYDTTVFKTDYFYLTLKGNLVENMDYNFRYAIADIVAAPAQGNTLEIANLVYKLSDSWKFVLGRAYNKIGGIEVNYFPPGTYYMYSLTNLNLLNNTNAVGATAINLSPYADGVQIVWNPSDKHTITFLVNNVNLSNPTANSNLAVQDTPSTGITWEGKFLEDRLVPFVSFIDIPLAPAQLTGGLATINAEEFKLATAGTRWISGNWTTHIDFLYYDFGQPNPAVGSGNHNFESAETVYIGYTQNRYLHKLTLTRSEVDVQAIYPSDVREGISYALEYEPDKRYHYFGCFTYTQDALTSNPSTGNFLLLNNTNAVNPQPLINNYNLLLGYYIKI